MPIRGIIKSVDAKKGTITLPGAKGKHNRVFALTKEVKLTLDGEKSDIKDIKAKMWVGGRNSECKNRNGKRNQLKRRKVKVLASLIQQALGPAIFMLSGDIGHALRAIFFRQRECRPQWY